MINNTKKLLLLVATSMLLTAGFTYGAADVDTSSSLTSGDTVERDLAGPPPFGGRSGRG